MDIVAAPDKSISFTVPGAPVPKGRPKARVVKGAGGGFAQIYTDAKTREYETRVGQWARKAMTGQRPIEGPCSLTVIFYFQLPKSRPRYQFEAMRRGELPCTNQVDLDNCLKAVQDGMNEIVFKDDRQIVSVVAHKRWADEPRVLVRVVPHGEAG